MRKIFSISMVGAIIILVSTSGIFAKSERSSAPKNFLTFSFFVNPVSIGYKHQVFGSVYATGNLDYRNSTNDLEFQVGTAYLFPRKIIIFRLYGGGGFQFSRNEGYQYPYVTVGTNFLFLFSEVIYPLRKNMDPQYRLGFSFKF